MTFHIIIACKIIYKWCVTHTHVLNCTDFETLNVVTQMNLALTIIANWSSAALSGRIASKILELLFRWRKEKIEERKNRESLVWFVHWNRSTKEIREEIHHSSKLPTGHDKFHRVTLFFSFDASSTFNTSAQFLLCSIRSVSVNEMTMPIVFLFRSFGKFIFLCFSVCLCIGSGAVVLWF